MENVKDHSKTSISVMWCGNAAGDCLPPMIVYKAQTIYESWVKGGHKGTVYQCTKSGCMCEKILGGMYYSAET